MNYELGFFTIPELELDEIKADNSKFSVFHESVDRFIDIFPDKSDELRKCLEVEDYEALVSSLIQLMDMLKNIYANKLAAECLRQINELENIREYINYDGIEGDLTHLLSSVSMLSIDLQMQEVKEENLIPSETAPAEKPPVAEPIAPNTKPILITETKSNQPPHLLLVDDSSIFLNLITAFMKDSRYHLVCANSGAEAVSYIKQNKPDMFILDILMPEMDGYQLATKIREAGHTAPIIFLTSNSSRSAVIKAVKAGAVDFVLKPVRKDMLLKRIESNLNAYPFVTKATL
ncbi:MAG: response regulator [Lachnospiraceae bacterium]|nr:response regulator [Lachnospiraceae bacterium]